jgi:hypothetical protein
MNGLGVLGGSGGGGVELPAVNRAGAAGDEEPFGMCGNQAFQQASDRRGVYSVRAAAAKRASLKQEESVPVALAKSSWRGVNNSGGVEGMMDMLTAYQTMVSSGRALGEKCRHIFIAACRTTRLCFGKLMAASFREDILFANWRNHGETWDDLRSCRLPSGSIFSDLAANAALRNG